MSSGRDLGGSTPGSGRPDVARWRAIAARERGVTVLVRAPSPALASFVEWIAYYDMRLSPDWRELVLPTGTMLLVVNMAEEMACWRGGDARVTACARRGALLVGASAGPYVVRGTEFPVVALVSFRPGGSYPFFEAPGSAISEPAVELGALWGRDGAVLRERLLEAATPQQALSTLDAVLVTRAVRPLAADRAVAAAAAMLGRGTAVAEVADRVGWTYRTLLRRFSEQAGLTPKRFVRVRRLQRLITGIPVGGEVDWDWAAAECGYFDQAHLINEFRTLTGLTPGAYRLQPGCRNHQLPPGCQILPIPASAPSAIMGRYRWPMSASQAVLPPGMSSRCPGRCRGRPVPARPGLVDAKEISAMGNRARGLRSWLNVSAILGRAALLPQSSRHLTCWLGYSCPHRAESAGNGIENGNQIE